MENYRITNVIKLFEIGKLNIQTFNLHNRMCVNVQNVNVLILYAFQLLQIKIWNLCLTITSLHYFCNNVLQVCNITL